MTGGVFADKVKKKEQNPNFYSSDFAESGGDEGDRTLDLTDANRTLSQLSYAPRYEIVVGIELNRPGSPASHDKQNIIDGKGLKIKQKTEKERTNLQDLDVLARPKWKENAPFWPVFYANGRM